MPLLGGADWESLAHLSHPKASTVDQLKIFWRSAPELCVHFGPAITWRAHNRVASTSWLEQSVLHYAASRSMRSQKYITSDKGQKSSNTGRKMRLYTDSGIPLLLCS
ncbi:hypothetical protein VFPPC_18713 [Pochonia chlamydosporia 170]|uniref:Uncharacterized protein n=1 Tax=Pochonia chlamydosporia 170 TaxID=1380566 RepID=A0A219AS21_METCM|nr:hypothetical protein VFPPC_18713 [Pochonia chlamydosporia 170]OWT43560.1 hypothetical protein VFPPC_18713 [Pochonia chlamydosporia 170]